MSTVNLLQPILDGGVQRNNFFNGRLLSAEDLRAEQDANREQRSQLASAIGDGVASGLEVSVISTTARTVRVRSGLAINRRLDLLSLADDTDVTLVPSAPSAADTGSGVFGECEPPRTSAAYTGAGVYVLVAAPASGYSGSALISDANTTSAGRGSCGARFSVEGFRFRLIPMELTLLSGLDGTLISHIESLLPPPTDSARERLRNALAHLCFGTQAIDDYFIDPLGPIGRETTWAGWGAVDAMRDRGDLTDCDVPLALVVLTTGGISFVDTWSVRRKLVGESSISTWRGVAGPRRVRDAEAAFLQFQSQLVGVRTLEPAASSIAGSNYFEVLPPAGWLPTNAPAFDWQTFLGDHAPSEVTPIDAALVRGIIERSWLDDPFVLATAPPVPLQVFEVPGASYVVFARSQLGNVRVTLSPVPADAEQVEVVLTARTGSEVHGSTRENGRVMVPGVQPGTHDLTIVAPDYEPVAPQEVQVVGGRTTDLVVTLTPLPNGIIAIDAQDSKSDDTIATSKIIAISASGGGITRAAVARNGRWEISDLPDGMYTVTGTATGYKAAAAISVGPTAKGTTVEAVLRFDPAVKANPSPSKCIKVAKLQKPKITNARLCLVLVASEFEEKLFGKLAKDEGSAIAKETYRITARRDAESERGARYVAATGEIVYRDRERFAKMTTLDELPKEVRQWLKDWAVWLAADLGVPAIAKAEPVIVVNPKYVVPREAAQVPVLPPAYAVFGPLSVPISIRVENDLTRLPVRLSASVLPWVSIGTFESLARADIIDLNDLAWSWRELVLDATGDPPDTGPYLIADAGTAVASVNAFRGYYPGVTSKINDALTRSGFPTDLSLANANVTKLADTLKSRGAAVRIIAEAQQIVPRDAWSLEGLPLAEYQIGALYQRGIESKGEFVERTKDAAGKSLIAEALGVETSTASKRDEVINPIVNEALSGLAQYAIELAPTVGLAKWEGMDPSTAMVLEDSGIGTVEELARAGEDAVAAAGNMTKEAAKALVDKAQRQTIESANVESILSLGASSTTKLNTVFGGTKPTVGAILTKDAGQLADAFGGEGRAGSILKGFSQGLSNRGIG